jgi:hypothetical protein
MMRNAKTFRIAPMFLLLFGFSALLVPVWDSVCAQQPGNEKAFTATVTDMQGIETSIKNVYFYWEEQVSETAFVPHEFRSVPVKRGAGTLNVKFESIKVIDVKPSEDKGSPTLAIHLTNGKSGEFLLSVNGKFKGQSDFGEVEYPAGGLKKIVFK